MQDGIDVPLRAGHVLHVHGVVSSGMAALLLPLEAPATILGVWTPVTILMHAWLRYAGSVAGVSTAAQLTMTVGIGRMVLTDLAWWLWFWCGL